MKLIMIITLLVILYTIVLQVRNYFKYRDTNGALTTRITFFLTKVFLAAYVATIIIGKPIPIFLMLSAMGGATLYHGGAAMKEDLKKLWAWIRKLFK